MTIDLPDLFYAKLREFADASGLSLERLLASAAAEKLSAMMDEDAYLQHEGGLASREAFVRVLAKIPDVDPEACDRLP